MALPPSAIDTHDYEKYPPGPNVLAKVCEDRIAELEAAKAECRTKAECRVLNKELHTIRGMLRWCRSRAGYVATPQDMGLLDRGDLPAI